MEYEQFSAKTVDDAITAACEKLGVTSDKLDYEVIEEGAAGFLGIGSKQAVIKAAVAVVESSKEEKAKNFLKEVFAAMNMAVNVEASYDEAEKTMSVDLSGEDMGVLIGKRGQTLDSLQYLVSLVINKGNDDYIRVKVDTEDYRERRKTTLENLAKKYRFKVKRTKHSVSP
jgi:spoIIIJ-associated protein